MGDKNQQDVSTQICILIDDAREEDSSYTIRDVLQKRRIPQTETQLYILILSRTYPVNETKTEEISSPSFKCN